jgi:hypothetical protein
MESYAHTHTPTPTNNKLREIERRRFAQKVDRGADVQLVWEVPAPEQGL